MWGCTVLPELLLVLLLAVLHYVVLHVPLLVRLVVMVLEHPLLELVCVCLLLSALLYAPGVILFAKAKHEVGQPIFTNVEKLIFAGVVIGALIAAYGLYDGFLTL